MRESNGLTLALGAMLGASGLLMMGTAFAGSLPSNIQTEQSKLGTVYATASGRSVYEFKRDTPHSGKSACYGACATEWTPVAAPAGFNSSGEWGAISRKNGGKQVTYKGWPLYTWKGDKKPGQITGQGVESTWRVVTTKSSEPGWSQKP